MRFLGWLFVVLAFAFIIGFFVNWVDVSKKEGVISFHVNQQMISHDVRSAGDAIRTVFEGIVK